jgi:hypothetical protein
LPLPQDWRHRARPRRRFSAGRDARLSPGALQLGNNPATDHLALELCKKNVRPTVRRPVVDRLFVQDQRRAAGFGFAQRVKADPRGIVAVGRVPRRGQDRTVRGWSPPTLSTALSSRARIPGAVPGSSTCARTHRRL